MSLSPSPTTLKQEEEFFNVVHGSLLVHYTTAAALTWTVYDILLTFNQEVSLIWSAKWSINKILYFFVRYYTLLSMIIILSVNTSYGVSYEFCKHWFWFEGFSGPVIASLLGEAMFLMRIYASYGKSHLILVLIGALYFGEFVLAFVADRLEVGSTFTIPRPTNYPIPGCLASLPQYTHLALASWIYSMVVACVYFALTMFKFAQNVMFAIRNSPKSFLSLGEFKKLTPILFLFVRDGALYFLAVLLCDVINLVFIAGVSNSPIEQMGTAWMMATYAVASSRLCLNLRSSLGTVGGMTTDIEMQGRTLESNFRFATAPSDIVTTTSATN